MYATIACVSHLCDVDEDALFTALVRSIGVDLPRIIVDGLEKANLESLVLTAAVRYCARIGVILRYTMIPLYTQLGRAWDHMQAHQQRHGRGSILVGLSGVYEHWTCIERVTPRCLMLADSGDLRRLYRAHTTIGEPRGARKHCLDLSSTFLFTVET